MSVVHQSQTIDFSKNLSTSKAMGSGIQIHFSHVDESLRKLNVIVEFTDMSASWLTKLFKSYENDLWCRSERFSIKNKRRIRKYWFYHCGLCENVYKQFSTIKSHINRHLKFFPYVCTICGRKYASRKGATVHLKRAHKIKKDEWNKYLTS